MSDQPTSATDVANADKPANSADRQLFNTPLGIVMGGFGLWILAALAAAMAGTALMRSTFDDETARIMASYMLYLPSVLLAVGGCVMTLIGSVRWAMHGRDSKGAASPEAQQIAILKQINARLLLSETAKRVAYRHEDMATLRKTIDQDIQKRDYDSALALVAEMATTYGQLEEAEDLRDRINVARKKETEAKIAAAVEKVDQLLGKNEYERAMKEASKLERLFPDADRVTNLRRHVLQAREQFKQDLEKGFLEAAQREDVDKAMTLLKEMDKYLTEQEAAPYRETARGVIGKQRDNLGVQFKLAVHDRDWVAASRVGEQLIRDFPNSKMANEVRGMLDVLRERAGAQQSAQSAAGVY